MRIGLIFIIILTVVAGGFSKNISFRIDGKDEEWDQVKDISTDITGDIENGSPESDLKEFRVRFDENYNMYVVFKTAARPFTAGTRQESFLVWIKHPDLWAMLRIHFKNIRKQAAYKVYDSRVIIKEGESYGDWYRVDYPYEVNDVAEAMIPLGQIYDQLGIVRPSELWITPEVRLWDQKEYFDWGPEILVRFGSGGKK